MLFNLESYAKLQVLSHILLFLKTCVNVFERETLQFNFLVNRDPYHINASPVRKPRTELDH